MKTKSKLGRKFLFLASIFLIIWGCFFAKAGAQTSLGGFEIANYQVEIDLRKDSTFLAREEIEVNFFEPRHGIFRKIPFKYKDNNGFNYNLNYKVISVTNENGQQWKFEKYQENGEMVLKIGDPYQTITGQHHFVITYEVVGGLRFFGSWSELYWNAIGTDWQEVIRSSEVTVNLPAEIELQPSDLVCYTGTFGSQEQNCHKEIVSKKQLRFVSEGELGNFKGLTIAVKFPAGYIKEPSFWQKTSRFLIQNGGIFLPVLVLGLMMVVFFKYGREIDHNKTIIARYEPPQNLSPGEMGYLLKEQYEGRFVSADVIDLAVKGYLKIRENSEEVLFFKKKSYELIKLNKKDEQNSDIRPHQKELLKKLFKGSEAVKLSELKNFYQDILQIKKTVEKQIDEAGFFEKSFLSKRNFYRIAGFLGFIFLFSFGIMANRTDFIFGSILSLVIVLIFAFFMSKKTKKGMEIFLQLKGFEEYIRKAERYRVRFQEKENLFEKYLPFAMVFGLAEKWTKAFEGIVKTPPVWYESTQLSFSVGGFTKSLENFSQQTASKSVRPSSSGSGFSGGSSGGGGGGGGGGSW